MKLQEAYASERSKAGDWTMIGYKSPAGNTTGKASTTNFEYDAGQDTYNWTAKSEVGLNDCAKGKIWYVNAKYTESTGNVDFYADSDDATNCSTPLTPNFTKLSTTAKFSVAKTESAEDVKKENEEEAAEKSEESGS